MTLQASFTAGEISPSLRQRVDREFYATGTARCLNFIVRPEGGVSRRAGTRFLSEAGRSVCRLIPFAFSLDQSYLLEIGHKYVRVHTADGYTGIETASPFSDDDLGTLRWSQLNDYLVLTSGTRPPFAVKRISASRWTVERLYLGANVYPPTNVDVEAYVQKLPATLEPYQIPPEEDYRYVITTVSDAGEESEASEEGDDKQHFPMLDNDRIAITWDAAAGANYYRVYKWRSGAWGVIGETNSTEFRDDNIMPDFTKAPPDRRYGFDSLKTYPSVVASHEQRLLFANTPSEPNAIFASRVGNPFDFSAARPSQPDEAFTFRLDSVSLDEVLSIVSRDDLLVFTASDIWRVHDNGEGFAPANVLRKPQTSFGASGLPVLSVGNNVLYTTPSKKSVRDLKYSYEVDGYTGHDVSVLSRHLLEDASIVDWCYQESPDSLIWIVLDDGSLVVLTYLPEHKIFGWSRHDVGGYVLSIAAFHDSLTSEDVVAMAVERNGQTNIERLQAGMYLDGNLSADFPAPVTWVAGLHHLEGLRVSAIIDGYAESGLLVSGGRINLPFAGSSIVAGMPYTSDLETLEPPSEQAHGNPKKTARLNLRVLDTRGLKVGPNWDHLDEHKARDFEDWSEAPVGVGEIDLVLWSSWSDRAKICIRQDYPLPANILAVIPEVHIGRI